MAEQPEPTLTIHDGAKASGLLEAVLPLYAEVYAEPPYHEGPDDVAEFGDLWPSYVEQPGFRLVLAELRDETVGFVFGFRLTPETSWWDGFLDPVDAETAREWNGRTFAIIELAVGAPYRRRGIARQLHEALLSDQFEERVSLCARPEAEAAMAVYRRWGYQAVGRTQPGPEKPVYVAMIRALGHGRG